VTTFNEEPKSLAPSYKFIRRPDIGKGLRLHLAILVLVFGYHGQVVCLSQRYGVSRSFIYNLKNDLSNRLEGLFEDTAHDTSRCEARNERHLAAVQKILNLRLIGKCSLSAISELMSLEDSSLPHSTCFISNVLDEIGSSLGSIVDWEGQVHYACDEIFMVGHEPVLVTLDPVSSSILQIERFASLTKEAWQKHWQKLREANIIPLGIVKDGGKAMAAAQAEIHGDVPIQLDTFHAVSKRLGIFVSRLEKSVDKAIEYEWERQRVMQNTKSEEVKASRQMIYEEACQQTLIAIEQYESFQFLYSCLVEQFNCFDYQGKVRGQEFAGEEAKCALDSMKELKIDKLDAEIESIEKILPRLFDFLPKAKLMQFEVEAQLGETLTYFWIYAWQNDKRSRKTKNAAKNRALQQKSKTALELLEEDYQISPEDFETLRRSIFTKFDTIIQSSALVETINSLLRTYMDGARNQLSQEQLNMIGFYLNHRVYKRGKRKGFAPIELLKGKKMEKIWQEILLERAA
jgi:ASC-1-like (ASCH) protein